MTDSDLGDQPDPVIEPGEPNPGGVDATVDSDGVDTETSDGDPILRDLDPDSNPAVEDALPDEMKRSEDTDTKATKKTGEESGSDDEGDSDEESPA